MAETSYQETQVRLVSKADNSGFAAFEGASDRVTASKERMNRSNGLLVESERRVRTNLVATVAGLAQANDAAGALAAGVSHLSEVFALGFGGTIIAGVGAAFISQFSKGGEAIDAMAEKADQARERIAALREEVEGIKVTPIIRESREIAKEETALRGRQAQQNNPGFFATLAIGAQSLFGFGNAADKYGTAVDDSYKDQSDLVAAQSALAAKKRDQELADSRVKGFSDRKPESNANAEAFRSLVENQELDDDIKKKQAEESARTAAASAREQTEAQKKAADEKARQARETARDDREEGSERRATGYKVQLHNYAGAQREEGGGGRAYSTIIVDPVVAEARKSNQLLAEINGNLKASIGAKPALRLAA